MITPLTKVSFSAVLKAGNRVRVQFATLKGNVLAAMYFVQIDYANPVLFDLRKCVTNKAALELELMKHTDKLYRTDIVKRILATTDTDFILKNQTELQA